MWNLTKQIITHSRHIQEFLFRHSRHYGHEMRIWLAIKFKFSFDILITAK